MRQLFSGAGRGVLLVVIVNVALGVLGPAQAGQLTPDQAAMQLLNSARRGHNERNYPFAAERFREFLKLYGGHKEALSAQYGLALALLEGPAKDYAGAVNALGQAVGREDFADRPFALHYMGVALRGVGYQELAQAEAKPPEAPNFYAKAKQHFEEAGRSFAAAATAFAARVKAPPAPDAQPPEDLEWAARARCDQCEMLLRVDKLKEANDLIAAFLADPALARSRYRSLGLYHAGYASFALKDYLGAGKALSQLAPFRQEFGPHARFLLARTHHLADERPEAVAQYKALLADYDEQKKAAAEAMKNPNALKPEQRDFFDALVKNPPPDYILRASFYLALLQAEDGRFADALAGFSGLIQQYPKSPLVPEAQLRVGYCQMQLRTFPEAIKALQPLCEHPQLGDQALWWLARSQAGAADPNNAPAYDQALRGAIETLRRAADRAGQLAKTDPAAKVRRGDILLELADTQQLAKLYKEAAATYQLALTENNNPDRAEEAMQRQATALHLAGMFKESDDLCRKFEATFPKSTLMPAVLFRAAENAYLAAAAAAANPNLPNREQELPRLFGEAVTRYQRLLKQYPDFAHINLARNGMATAHYRLGHYVDAIPILSAIPEPDRTGELVSVPYLLADCLIRTLPPEAEDALQAAKLVDQAEQSAKLLEAFLGAQPKSPQAPDALLKLAHCYQRVGAVLIDPAERQKTLTSAKEACERLQQQFPQDPSLPMAVFERAKCIALLGDSGGAINELGRFRADPLKSSPVAPLALVRLSALLRAQNKPADAAALMAECRNLHEGNLLKDPARSDWVPALQYEHALAIRESGRLPEARAIFEAMAKQFAGRPEAVNAQWRTGQCRREELMAALAVSRATLTRPGAKPEEIAAARTAIDEGLKSMGKTVEVLLVQAEELGKKASGSEAHLSTLYEMAWCYRVLAEAEIEAARSKLQREALEKVQAKLAKEAPPGQAPPALRPPDIPLSAIPLQPSEKLAVEQYSRLIVAAPDSPLSIQARLELAEVQAQRANHTAALDLLAEALEKNPPIELAERIRLRLAVISLDKGDAKAALGHVQAVARNAATPFAGEVRYLTGEAFIQQKDWPQAIQQLLPFRDQQQLHYVPGISDRALLRLGQVQAQAGQWDASRATFDALVQRFPQSIWVDEARYGVGWAWQNMKQLDNALAAYIEVTKRTSSELAAKAQLQIGLCRLEQKNYPEAIKALLVVPFTYDYPEQNALALCMAAQAHVELKQPAEAVKLWQQVVKNHPTSQWVKLAQQGLAGVKQE